MFSAILIYSAGLRVSEAVSLRVSDIRSEQMCIFIENGKGRKARYAILSERCLQELRQYWLKFRPENYLFPSCHSGKTHFTKRSMQGVLQAAVKKANLPDDITPHTLRRTFASHMIEANVGIFQTRDALGHNSLRSTQKYVYLPKIPTIKSPYDS